jgi:hypothetical protein
MRIKPGLACLLGLLFSSPVFAQNKSLAVNKYTGAASVAIPLYNITSGTVAMPVTAVYQTAGVRVKDESDNLGLHGQLVAGGEISRTVRGLPDDIKVDKAGNARLGWLYNTNGTKINSFTISNDNSTAVCIDETADNNYISTNFSDLSDTEPDIFNVNAPGLSCQFVFDNGHVIKTIPYQDLDITYTTALSGRIESFTVKNERGTVYVFGAQELETRTATNPGAISYFKRQYDQYASGIIYNRSWKLTEMSSFFGGGINIFYTAGIKKIRNDVVSVVLPGSSASTAQYTINTSYTPTLISSVATGDFDGVYTTVLSVDYRTAGQQANNYYEEINGMGRHVTFTYANAAGRNFLKSITIEGAGVKKQYGFSYYGLTYKTPPTFNILNLPDSTSKEIDYWGYYNANGATSLIPKVYINPSTASMERYRNIPPGAAASNFPYLLTGTDRSASFSAGITGSLSKVYSNLGDTTYVEYELNSFYDNTAGSVVNGGGLRVKKVTTFDGFDTANNMVTNYSYLDPVTGLSSGRAVNMPSYAFTTPYIGSGTTEAQWANSTIRSENDLSDEDETVVYKYVTVSMTGAGNMRYEYSVPATYWDASASPDWAPTVVYSGRVACTAASFANNQTNNYPYAPNTNFDFERGLLKTVSTYNQAGQQVSEENYTYQRSYASPTVTTGFKFDNNTTTARNYAKYSIYTGTSELIATQSKKVFDLPALSSSQNTTTAFNYTSSAHKLPTRTDVTNSDGSIVKNFIKYVKDYTTTLGADSMANSLYRLRQLGINSPIEQYQQVQRTGTTVTTNASLTLYKKFFYGFVNCDFPVQSLQLVSAAGLPDFQPSVITANTFTHDSRYLVKANYLAYDNAGLLATADDNKHNMATTLNDAISGQPFLMIKNAALSEFAFDDFDSNYQKAGFTYTDTLKRLSDRNGQNAIYGKPTSIITRTITKNPLATNYIFSVWVNADAANITVMLTNASNQTSSYVLSFPNTNGKWQYQQIKVPVTNMSAVFTVKLIPSYTILIDDILFYPENSQVSTTAYNRQNYAKLSETNSNGVSIYYGYDNFGRPKFVYDQDKNIIQKKTYADVDDYKNYNAGFTVSLPNADSLNYGSKLVFQNLDNTNLEGTKWSWDFGDGSSVASITIDTVTRFGVMSRYNQVLHAYNHTGNFTITLTKTSPVAGTVTATNTIYLTNHNSLLVPFSITNRPGATITQVAYSGVWGSDSKPAAQINLGDLAAKQGIYDITVNTAGSLYNSGTGNGFKCVVLADENKVLDCINYHAGNNVYNFYHIDLNGKTSVKVYFSTDDCSVVNPIDPQFKVSPGSGDQ